MDWDISRSSSIVFKNRPYVKLHNEDSPIGLCVIRPSYKKMHVDRIDGDSVTVLAPYFDNCDEFDEPEALAEEYISMKNQKIIIKEG